MHRNALLVLVLLAACDGGEEPGPPAAPVPGWADHTLTERWHHEGYGEAWALATADLDGDPGDELVLVRELDSIVVVGVPASTDDDAVAVYAYDGDGTLLWTFAPSANPLQAAVADIDGDGLDEVALAEDGLVEVAGADGRVWGAHVDGLALWIHAADVDEDGADEVFASTTWDQLATVVAFAPDGTEQWTEVMDGDLFAAELGDADGDGIPELLVGSGVVDGEPIRAVATAIDLAPTATNRVVWSQETGTPAWAFATADIDGERVVLVGGDTTRLDAVDATGALAWSWVSGGFVNAVASADLDGDGAAEVLHADGSGHLVASAEGEVRWTRRIDVGGDGEATGVATGDLDGDGELDLVVSGLRYMAEDAGVLERYTAEGELVFSVTVRPFLFDPRLADIDGDGTLEIIVAEAGFPGCGASAWSADGALLWQSVLGECIVPTIAVGDADGDGDAEIAYGDTHWAPPFQVAMLEGDGTTLWKKELGGEDTYWVAVVKGGMVHGGFGTDAMGHVTQRTLAEGRIAWTHGLEGIPDPELPAWLLSGGSLHGALAPDLDGDGVAEILSDNYAGDVRLLDGATGEALWVTRLEDEALPWHERHEGAVVAWVPETTTTPAWVVAGQGSLQRSRSATVALDADGRIVGRVDRDGWGTGVTVTAGGAVVGGGLGVHAVEPAPR